MANGNDDDDIIDLTERKVDGASLNQYSLTKSLQDKVDKNMASVVVPKTADQIMKEYTTKIKQAHFLQPEKFDDIGEALIANRANIDRTAQQFGLRPHDLRILIRSEPILWAYWEIAYQEVKGLVDSKVLDILEREGDDQDKTVILAVFKTLYGGRAKGGYNPNEFGLVGYGDPVASKQRDAVQEDVDKDRESKVNVILQFNDRTVEIDGSRTVASIMLDKEEEDYVDAEECPLDSDEESDDDY